MIEGLGTLDPSANAEWNELAPLQELDGPLSGGNHKAIGRSVLDSIRANRKSLRGQRDRVFGRLHELGISTEIFERAQAEALQTGSPITQILFADGTLHPNAYYGLLAKELDLPFSATIDPSTILTDMGNASCVLGRPAQVFCRSNDGLTVLFIAPDAVGEQAIRDLIANDPSQRRRICITVPKAVQFALTERREHKLLDEATNGLYRRNPDHSAKIVASPWQGFATGCFLGVMPFALMFAFDIVIALVHLLASAIFSFGLYVRLGALRRLADRKPCDPHSVTGPVPIYSVLVALYKEAPVIAQLVEAMSQLDWPKERLEVLYVCEADDRATIEALEAQHLPYHHRIIEVPPGEPRTKPKALNYALQLCSGEMVVIYDAEDRPHPQQLKQAWASMVDGGEMLACVQAPLFITNGSSSWISRMFAFEYLTHFAGLLPHLARLGVPLPLGGTSNHFRGLM